MTRARIAATATALALALGVGLGLGGCAGSPPEITSGTSELMQSTVVTAANQVAASDPTGALATLDSLQSQLDQATATGDISTERAAAIQQAIDQVRADLTELTAPETAVPATTEPEPEPTTPDDTGDKGNKGNKGDKGDKGDKGKKGSGKDK